MLVDLQPTTTLDADALQELRDLSLRVHGLPSPDLGPGQRLSWTGVQDMLCFVQVREHGLLVSSLAVTQRTILVDGQAALAGGICGVLTHPEFRRRGLARAALERATTYMQQDLQVELGILFSSPMGVPLYRSLGWQIIDGPVWCQQPDGTINYTESRPTDPPMWLPSAEGRQPPGQIDLCGLPW